MQLSSKRLVGLGRIFVTEQHPLVEVCHTNPRAPALVGGHLGLNLLQLNWTRGQRYLFFFRCCITVQSRQLNTILCECFAVAVFHMERQQAFPSECAYKNLFKHRQTASFVSKLWY